MIGSLLLSYFHLVFPDAFLVKFKDFYVQCELNLFFSYILINVKLHILISKLKRLFIDVGILMKEFVLPVFQSKLCTRIIPYFVITFFLILVVDSLYLKQC